MTYRLSKINNGHVQNLDVTKNPFARLLGQLSGVSARPPKKLQVEQQWSKECYDSKVKAAFEEHWASAGLPGNQCAAERAKFTAARFRCETEAERAQWAAQAQAEHETAMQEWKLALEAPSPSDPQSRQE